MAGPWDQRGPLEPKERLGLDLIPVAMITIRPRTRLARQADVPRCERSDVVVNGLPQYPLARLQFQDVGTQIVAVGIPDFERATMVPKQAEGKRLTYRPLVRKNPDFPNKGLVV